MRNECIVMRITGIVHAQGIENPLFQKLLVWVAGNLFQNRAQQEVSRVAVIESGSRRKLQIAAAILLGKIFDAVFCSAGRSFEKTRSRYEIGDTRSVRE